jgi:hypothetical protein
VILAFIQRYLTAGLAFLALTGFFYGGIQTYRLQALKLKNAEAFSKAQQAARDKEADWQIIYQETTHAKDTELRSVAAERDRALASLRNRPRDRLPETPASCAGSSPAALAAEDAAVVIGFAAEFDELRANYADCKVKLEAR